ncbi:BirA family transcriptional regulator, biotin operon repressor / biotin-[acetyl-CoA-carboxylase] ligase [Malonomonas rubra DSM 5091]|uniref:Bifunctional ligase/repressor BirA n=1 Tax=Malonomonas rubra DSM 5091 TaxID=1122189 RepID=A0A1M6NLC8_MALRU|nr:biotin--[acetyl-CoA-carboxylase] ligase [Malonomonas rubra]SHJ96541.1 BirA family transcriptional regulator, biotin operon repressor / biotin-[acetyl-CoA-carboxylase] ligase [Malonomonas rubra DSM 5091]
MTSRDKILSLFRSHPDAFISGQEISQQLNISRAAVWKQVELLREQGFEIEAQRSKGYRLVDGPDLLLAAEIEKGLNCSHLSTTLICLPELDSTNARARQLAEEDAAEGTVVIADRQSAGRGRLGRCWESPSAVNLYCSILLRPQIPVQQAPQLTFLSAVAVAETLQQLYRIDAKVKWPNDVLVDGKKIAGLLNEMNAETEQIHFVILGIGVNLNMSTEQFPEELNYPATSVLIETGQQVDRPAFVRALLQLLDDYYGEFLQQGFVSIRRRWETLCDMMSQRVSVDNSMFGTVVGLDSDGALRLQLDDGHIERVMAGDVRPQ